ncbi:unnamed protein product [Paramecium pentaurelia]|uniref:Uncharacterized protein n=1 Tax=Paramecium pentaurelia TaxID=43138 RepID=A0A8S1YB23_9CILI|nr:unnamed protein product [Paramecium pentaurelia]
MLLRQYIIILLFRLRNINQRNYLRIYFNLLEQLSQNNIILFNKLLNHYFLNKFEVKLNIIIVIPTQLKISISCFNIKISNSPINDYYVTFPIITDLFIHNYPKQPRNPLNNNKLASQRETALNCSTEQYNQYKMEDIIPKKEKYCKIAKELTSYERELISTQANEVVTAVKRAKHNPKKLRQVNSSLFQLNKIGGLEIKITPKRQNKISRIVLFVITSFFRMYAKIKVVHKGLVFIKTTASETVTNFNDKKQERNPTPPMQPRVISFLSVLLEEGYVLFGMNSAKISMIIKVKIDLQQII